jgi:hypothetical protein
VPKAALPPKRELTNVEPRNPAVPNLVLLKVELRDAEPLKCALAKFELARFVERAEDVEREAETADAERPALAPTVEARLFIAVDGPALLAELPKEWKLPVLEESRAAAFAVPPPEFPNECQPGDVFA